MKLTLFNCVVRYSHKSDFPFSVLQLKNSLVLSFFHFHPKFEVFVSLQFSNTNLTSAGANLIKSGLISVTAVKEDASHPRALILDQSGRTVDAAGRAIQLTSRMPTLKANIRAKKAEQFKIEKPTEDLIESKYFDARVG